MHGLFLYLVFVLEQNACIIVPARILTDGDRFDPVIFRYRSVLFDLHIPCFWKLQVPIFKGYRALLVIRCIRSAGFMSGFEFRKSNFRIPEEVIICLLQIHLCICKARLSTSFSHGNSFLYCAGVLFRFFFVFS